MLVAVAIADPDPWRAAATPHEQQPAIVCQRGLALVIGCAEETRRVARGPRIAKRHLPDIEVAAAVRRKDDQPAVRRPSGLSIPFGPGGNASPLRVGRYDPDVTANA